MILIPGERHDIGHCVSDILMRTEGVTYSAYQVPHPLANDVLVVSEGEGDERERVVAALDELKATVDSLLLQLE